MKRFHLVLFVCLVAWILITETTAVREQSSDGLYQKGFPFIFIREILGKGEYANMHLGFMYKNFFIDMGLVVVAAILITFALGFFKKSVLPK